MQIRSLVALICGVFWLPTAAAQDAPPAAEEGPQAEAAEPVDAPEPTEAEREQAQREQDSRDGEAAIRGFYAAMAAGNVDEARTFLLPSAWDDERFEEDWVLGTKSLELRRVYVGGRDMEGVLYSTVDHCHEVRVGEFHAWSGEVKLAPFEGGWRLQGWDAGTVPWSIGDYCPVRGDKYTTIPGALGSSDGGSLGGLLGSDEPGSPQGGEGTGLGGTATLDPGWKTTCKECKERLGESLEERSFSIAWCGTVSLARVPRDAGWAQARFRVVDGRPTDIVVKADEENLKGCVERQLEGWLLPVEDGDYAVRKVRWSLGP